MTKKKKLKKKNKTKQMTSLYVQSELRELNLGFLPYEIRGEDS